MPDPIDRKALLEEIQSWAVSINNPTMLSREDTLYLIEQAPAITPESLARHGRWEDKPTGAYGRWQSWCSVCGKHSGIGGIERNRHKSYCPHCGAKMDLEAQDEA